MIEDNFILFCMKSYENIHCSTVEEFEKDLEKITYLNRLFNKYYEREELNLRLILNHIIVLYNVFSYAECTEILFFKVKEKYHPALKTFLTYLSYMPEYVKCIEKLNSDIPIDTRIANELRKI